MDPAFDTWSVELMSSKSQIKNTRVVVLPISTILAKTEGFELKFLCHNASNVYRFSTIFAELNTSKLKYERLPTCKWKTTHNLYQLQVVWNKIWK